MLVIHSRQSNPKHFMAVFVSHVSTVTDMPLNEIIFIFFYSFRFKSKDFVGHKVISNSHVDSWHPTLGAKSSRVAPLSVWNLPLVIVLTLEVCSPNPRGAVWNSDKRQKACVSDNTRLPFFGRYLLQHGSPDTLMIYSTAVSGESQRTFYASVCEVGVARLAGCCLTGAPLWLVVRQFLLADWNWVNARRPQYLKPMLSCLVSSKGYKQQIWRWGGSTDDHN